ALVEREAGVHHASGREVLDVHDDVERVSVEVEVAAAGLALADREQPQVAGTRKPGGARRQAEVRDRGRDVAGGLRARRAGASTEEERTRSREEGSIHDGGAPPLARDSTGNGRKRGLFRARRGGAPRFDTPRTPLDDALDGATRAW